MNEKELRKDLRAGPTLINFSGREEVLKGRAKAVILKVLVPEDTITFNVIDILSEKLSSNDITELQQEPFGGDFKVVFFKGKDPKPCLRYKGHHTVLVAWNGGIPKAHVDVDCKRLYGARLKTWVRVNAQSRGIKLDVEDVSSIVDTFGNNMVVLSSQLDKLALLSEVSAESILQIRAGHVNANIWKFMDAIKGGIPGKALDQLQTLRQSGLQELQILRQLVRQFRLLLRQASGIDLSNEISEAEASSLAKFQGQTDFNHLFKLFVKITRVEWKIKEGGGSESLTILVIELCKEL